MNLMFEDEKKNYTLFAQNIVASVGKEFFKQDSALACLAKSDLFFKELTAIFNRLHLYEITPEKFASAFGALPASTDKNRLNLCAKVYEKYIDLMNQNGFNMPFVPRDIKKINPNFAKNDEIKSRLELLLAVFENKKAAAFDEKPVNSVAYREFLDVQNECDYIIQKIKENSDGTNFSDFAVFVDKTETRQKFADLLKAENIPIVSSIYNEDYENLKHKVNVYEKVSAICKELCLEDFNSENFKNLDRTANLNYISKSQKEICLELLDEVIKSLAEEIFTDSYTVDKILNLQEKNRKSFTESLFSSFNLISEAECETLAMEIGAIKSFYTQYKDNRYAKAIETVIMRSLKLFEELPELKQAVTGKIKSLNELQGLYDEILHIEPDFNAFKEILEWLPKDTKKDENAVRLASISADFKKDEECKYIFVAGLTENNFPAGNTSYPFISEQTNLALSAELRKQNSYYDTFLKTDEKHFTQRFYALCEVMCHAKEKIIFTTHSYESKKTVQPSVFFKVLKTKDSANFKTVKDLGTTSSQDVGKELGCVRVLVDEKKECVVTEKDILKLNPSAILAFQGCPRKYYFRNLLNLKEPSNFSASYGTIVHAVFEIMNRNHLSAYSKQTALALGEILFNAKTDAQKVLDFGFTQFDVDLICATDDLALEEMKENFKNALEDYENNGYFKQVPVKAVCEKDFSFTLEQLPNVVFDGRIDAILSNERGETSIVDYKTGKDKTNSLEYAISEYGVSFKSKTGKDPSNLEAVQNAYDYQIPLYYLACQNSPTLSEFKDKITYLGLMYVRPKNKHNGCNDDFVRAGDVEFYKDKIIENLKNTVIDKIRNEKEFKTKEGFGCEYCGFSFLCDGGSDDE